MKLSSTEIEKDLERWIKNFDGKALDLTTLCGALLLINRLKAENKNCGVKIQNQREQLKACNEKIKRLEVDNEKLKRLEFQADALNEAYEESVREAVKEFAERLKEKAKMPLGTLYGEMLYIEDIDNLLKEMGCE